MTLEEYLEYLRRLREGGGDNSANIFTPQDARLAVGQEPLSNRGIMAAGFLTGNPFFTMATALPRLADRGILPSGLNRMFGSRASANVEQGLPAVINMKSVYDDFGYGDSGPSGSYDGAASMSEYSADPTSFSGSF